MTAETLFDVPASDDIIERFAVMSPCERYRYALGRTWDLDRKPVLFVGLNPSTADADNDDPTIRRCIRFAKDWGHGGILMGNLFAIRATDPKDMLRAVDPVGERNDHWLERLTSLSGCVVAAWGVHGGHLDRAEQVVESRTLGDAMVLGFTKDGYPRHPLYMPADTKPFAWDVAAITTKDGDSNG